MIFTRLRHRSVLAALLLACGGSLAGYSQDPVKPQSGQPAQPAKEAPAPKPGELVVPAVAAPVDPKTYVIGTEDVVRVQVWREEPLSGLHIVRPDGRITLPLVREIDASGRTPEQLEKAIVEQLEKFLTKPEVMVSIAEVRSKRYWVLGEVGRSGPYPLVTPTTILQALSIAGLREWAKKSGIIIMRGDQRLKFNYDEVMKGKKMNQNILLLNGDHIIVR